MDDGVGLLAERVSRIFPSAFMNLRSSAGVRLGPRPIERFSLEYGYQLSV